MFIWFAVQPVLIPVMWAGEVETSALAMAGTTVAMHIQAIWVLFVMVSSYLDATFRHSLERSRLDQANDATSGAPFRISLQRRSRLRCALPPSLASSRLTK